MLKRFRQHAFPTGGYAIVYRANHRSRARKCQTNLSCAIDGSHPKQSTKPPQNKEEETLNQLLSSLRNKGMYDIIAKLPEQKSFKQYIINRAKDIANTGIATVLALTMLLDFGENLLNILNWAPFGMLLSHLC